TIPYREGSRSLDRLWLPGSLGHDARVAESSASPPRLASERHAKHDPDPRRSALGRSAGPERGPGAWVAQTQRRSPEWPRIQLSASLVLPTFISGERGISSAASTRKIRSH